MQFDFKELHLTVVSSYELLIRGSEQALIGAAEMDHFRPFQGFTGSFPFSIFCN